ncbi:MAG: GHKL domain-containing protein [Subdoligranulum sp.]|nr:GHKL domain-containing protein [Subdoligranulum sp.]
MEYWLSLMFNFMEYFALLLFFDVFFERRLQGMKFWTAAAILMLCSFFFTTLVHTPFSLVKLLGCLALFFLANCALYCGAFWMRLLTTMIGYAIIYLMGLLTQTGVCAIFSLDYEALVNDRALYILVGTGCDLLLLSLALALRQYYRPRGRGKEVKTVPMLLFPLVSLALLFPLHFNFYNVPQALPLLLICVAILECVNIGAVILIGWLQQNALLRERALAVNERLTAQTQSVEALSAAYAAQRKITHDFRSHLAALSDLVPQDAAPAAARYLEELQSTQTERILTVNTHHPAIDAVLNQKAQHAEKCGIDIQFEVNDLSALQIREIDCIVVLANLLDNAIEACAKLPQPERRIEVKALLENTEMEDKGVLFLSILNASPPVQIINGRIETTKEKPELHGFGLPNVREVLARYGVAPYMRFRDGTFQFSFEWPNLVC